MLTYTRGYCIGEKIGEDCAGIRKKVNCRPGGNALTFTLLFSSIDTLGHLNNRMKCELRRCRGNVASDRGNGH